MEFPVKQAWATEILLQIRTMAGREGTVHLTKHAREDRMKLRNVSPSDIRHCLMTGHDIDDIRTGDGGDIIYRVVGACIGGKPLRVPVVITDEGKLRVVTVIR